MESGYIKMDSSNLPKVDTFMVANFFACNPDFCSAEFRNAKLSWIPGEARIEESLYTLYLQYPLPVFCHCCHIKKMRVTRREPDTPIRRFPNSVSFTLHRPQEVNTHALALPRLIHASQRYLGPHNGEGPYLYRAAITVAGSRLLQRATSYCGYAAVAAQLSSLLSISSIKNLWMQINIKH